MFRPFALALCLLFLLAGCAEPGPAVSEPPSEPMRLWEPTAPAAPGWVYSLPRDQDLRPMHPDESLFLVRQALSERPLMDQPRMARTAMLQSESYAFKDAIVLISHAFPGTKISDFLFQVFQDRELVEANLRGFLRRDDLLLDAVAAQRLAHDHYPGGGWLITFRTPTHFCSGGISVLSARNRRDATGMTFDTFVRAFFCHADAEPPAYVRNMFHRLRLREGS